MIDELRKLLAKSNISDRGIEETLNACPAEIYFLDKKFISENFPVAGLPECELANTLAFAEKMQSSRLMRLMAWHLYRNFALKPMGEVENYPELIPALGYDTGLLYLLLLLAMIPHYKARAERERFPEKYACAAASRIGTLTIFFAQKHDGKFGIRARSMRFMLHFTNSAIFRIGRFDFMPVRDNNLPEIYGRGKEIIAFCNRNWFLDADGCQCDETAACRKAEFTADEIQVSGIPVNMETGLAEKNPVTIKFADGWQKISGSGDWTVYFHIPGGGKMTPEVCESSFREAREFFKSYYADRKFTLIWSNSWIFNPAWCDYLPDSNLTKLIKTGKLFPVRTTDKEGLYFVFGRDDDDFDSYTATNSMQRAMLKCRAERGLRRAGCFFPGF